MSLVIGLDPSLTNTGIAVLRDGQPLTLTSTGLGGHDGASHLDRSRRVRAVCRAVMTEVGRILDRHVIDLVAIEDVLSHGPMLPSAIDRHGLWHGLLGALDARKLPVVVINPMTAKKWATGSGRADKAMVLTEVRKWWPGQVRNHDQADAAVHAAIGAFHLGDPMPFPVKARHHAGLEAVAWPSNLCAKPEPAQVRR